MMNSRLRIGVIGAAAIARRSIVPSILALPEHFEFVGIASRTTATAEAALAGTPGRAFDGYQSILDNGSLDAVYIPLPNGLHYEWVRASLEKGVHVLVEKSLALTQVEVEELTALATERGLVLMENFQFRFHSQLQRIRDMVAEGTLGELRSVRSSFGFPPFADRSNIRYQADLGGGALLDAGAYTLKVSQVFLGNDIDVVASRMTIDPTAGVDIAGGGFLAQRDGDLFSEIAYGFDHSYQCSIELWGSRGRLTTNRIFTAPAAHVPELQLETSSGATTLRLEPDDHFRNMLIHFSTLAGDEGARSIEYSDNVNQARLIEQMRRKSHER